VALISHRAGNYLEYKSEREEIKNLYTLKRKPAIEEKPQKTPL